MTMTLPPRPHCLLALALATAACAGSTQDGSPAQDPTQDPDQDLGLNTDDFTDLSDLEVKLFRNRSHRLAHLVKGRCAFAATGKVERVSAAGKRGRMLPAPR